VFVRELVLTMFQNLALSIAPDGSSEAPLPEWGRPGGGHSSIEALCLIHGWSSQPMSYSPAGVFLNAFAVVLSLTPTRRRTTVNGDVLFEGWTPPGAMRIQRPGEHVATEMFTGFDQVALYIPTTTFQSILRAQSRAQADIDIVSPLWSVDGFIDNSLRCMAAALSRRSLESYHYLTVMGRAVASHVLYHYAAAAERARPGSDPDRGAVERAIQFIDAHLQDGPSLAAIASAADLPIDRFRREFKAATHMSPHRYLIRRRVDRACALIAASPRPRFADIALECGFADQSHLSTTFRRVLGVSPARFMRQV
jgi:AraC family transcriptional regulator